MIKKIKILLIILLIPLCGYADSTLTFENIGERVPIMSPLDEYDPESNSYPDPFSSDQILLTINVNNYT